MDRGVSVSPGYFDGMDIGMLGSRKSHEGGEKLLEVDGGVSGRAMRKDSWMRVAGERPSIAA